jgi:hypothetical protein
MMKKLFFIFILFSFCAKPFAQNNQYLILGNDEAPKKTKTKKVVKPTEQNPTEQKAAETTGENYTPTKSIDVGAGGIFTSLNFFKNAQNFTYYPAGSFRLYVQPNNFLQFVVDYSKVQQVNIIPTWINVQNTYLDLDAHFLLHPAHAERTIVYFVLGVTSQFWHGIYTGIDDYNHYVLTVKKNTDYKAVYYGGTIGVGFEFKVVNRINLYGEVRYKITQTDVGFGLSDVCYGAGVKYTLLDFHPKPVYNKPSKHFHWF